MRKQQRSLKDSILYSLLCAVVTVSFTALLASEFSSIQRSTAAVIPGSEALKKAVFKNWGLDNPIAKSHIQALDAWKIDQGKSKVTVAVIDTGIDPKHKDLSPHLWKGDVKTNPSKTTTSFGWDFSTNKSDPIDDHGHGTHVAGIIGAVADTEAGVSGVARNVELMPIKYYSSKNSGSVNLSNTIKALNFAIDNGARIINYSGGGPEFSQEEYLAIKRAEVKGILIVAAAGNERQNADVRENFYYPAAYGTSNIISVAATDIYNNLLPSSNWGTKNVDVAAPGENIYSTLPGNKYGYMSGTSQATAFVTGIAAMLLSRDPLLKPSDLKQIILDSTERFPSLNGKTKTGGRVNAFKALASLNERFQAPSLKLVVPPPAVAPSHAIHPPLRSFATQ